MKIKSTFKQALFVLALMTGALMLVSVIPTTAFAALIEGGDNPGEISAATGGATGVKELVLRMVNYFLTFLGILAVIMVIYGGVRYVVSAGNDEGIGAAKKIILYAVAGLIIVLLSFVIINTVLGAGLGGQGQ